MNESTFSKYVLSTDESWIKVYVFKAGLASFAAHNSIVTCRNIIGGLSILNGKEKRITSDLNFDLTKLLLNDPNDLKLEGPDFNYERIQLFNDQTRAVMESSDVLHISKYPSASVQVQGVLNNESSMTLKAFPTLRGVSKKYSVPCAFKFLNENNLESIHIDGGVRFKQSDFGIVILFLYFIVIRLHIQLFWVL